MIKFGNIAKRFITTFDNLHYTGSIINNGTFIEAGPILLANTGVYYLNEIATLKSGQSDKILKELEKGKIFIEKSSSSINYPINCAVWCYWSLFNKNRKKDMKELSTYLE